MSTSPVVRSLRHIKYLVGVVAFTLGTAATLFGLRHFNKQHQIKAGLSEIQRAFRNRRPTQTRIADLAYAPLLITRGGQASEQVPTELAHAERILLDAAEDQPGPIAEHALGELYLVEAGGV
ncbi:MAG TPA: hypothetical protein VI756_13135, partial [Blastocatellia bacterium]